MALVPIRISPSYSHHLPTLTNCYESFSSAEVSAIMSELDAIQLLPVTRAVVVVTRAVIEDTAVATLEIDGLTPLYIRF